MLTETPKNAPETLPHGSNSKYCPIFIPNHQQINNVNTIWVPIPENFNQSLFFKGV